MLGGLPDEQDDLIGTIQPGHAFVMRLDDAACPDCESRRPRLPQERHHATKVGHQSVQRLHATPVSPIFLACFDRGKSLHVPTILVNIVCACTVLWWPAFRNIAHNQYSPSPAGVRMRPTHRIQHALVTGAVVGAVVLSLAGCSSATDPAASTDSTVEGETFVIPQQTGVPPWAYTDDTDALIGMLPDLSSALAPYLGVTIENERTTWENSLLGLESEKYIFVPGADATPERLEKFDFAIALQDAYGFQVKAGNPEIADDMMALCGLSIGLPASSSPIQSLEEQSAKCVKAGEEAIEIKTFPDWASADLATQSGQVDTATATLSSMAYQTAENPDKWTITGPRYLELEIGFAVPKGSAWGPKLVDAFNEMIADGAYAAIFDVYGTSGMMIEESHLVTQ
ncbi:transporter substrate-binding domain-containing protein [Microbacterium sp. NPDC055357]